MDALVSAESVLHEDDREETAAFPRVPGRSVSAALGRPMATAGTPVAVPLRLGGLARRRRFRIRPIARSLAIARPSEQFVVVSLALLAYLVIAVEVVVVAHSIIGDAWSRVANAYYVFYSRDPHMAAIGFVWNPLPSVAVMPFLPFKAIWPDMVATGFAASIVSALFMAASVWQIYGIASDWKVRRSARLLVTILFAFNPMILYYGANGMSEAMFIATLLITVRYLARWAGDGETSALVISGLALATAYMTRYEAVVSAFGAFGVVVFIAAMRHQGEVRQRVGEGFADAAVFVAPVVTVFIGWAVASWLIVRDPFQQFTSAYGVVSQLAVAQSAVAVITGQGTSAAYYWILHQLIGLEPGIIGIGVLALFATYRGRLALTMPAMAVIGSVVAFAIFGFLTGRTLGWLRYSLAIIPLATVLTLAILAPDPNAVKEGRDDRAGLGRVGWKAMGFAAVVLMAIAVPIGAHTMLDPGQNPQYGGEAFQLAPILSPNQLLYPLDNPQKFTPTGQYLVGQQASQYLDSMRLPAGSVLVDGAMAFPIILESNDPTQFITTSDRDFQESLLDPVSFGVKYLLVPDPSTGYESLDAINRAYPGIYENGASVAPQMVAQFGSGGNNWRLYKVSS